MIRLYIENNEIELDKSVTFAITKQFEDLSNPTTIINDWSKTVSIPFTLNNNIIFGNMYNPDKSIVDGGSVGVYFNPLKKLNFRLTWNDTILMVGYAKLNEVKQVNGKGTYEVTLFGQLGKVFGEMQKITFDKSTTEADYLIDGGKYVDEYINYELVYKSWRSSGQTHDTLYPRKLTIQGGTVIDHPAYKVTDIIGFAPNNSFSNDFKYDTYQDSDNSSDTFQNELGTGFTSDTGVEPQTVIPNGYLPREIGEYRSYLQLPFIYWNKLFQVFKEKAEDVTGYTIKLDSDWFNTGNTYWYDLVYMLYPLNIKNGITYTNNYSLSFGIYGYGGNLWQTSALTSEVWQRNKELNMFTAKSDSSVEEKQICDYASPFASWSLEYNTVFNMNVRVAIGDTWGGSTPQLNVNNGLLVNVNAHGANGTIQTYKYLIKRSTSTVYVQDAEVITNDNHFDMDSAYHLISDINVIFQCRPASFGNSVYFTIDANWVTTSNPSTSNATSNNNKIITVTYIPLSCEVKVLEGAFRSNAHIILNDLWNNEYNLFNEIIRYCKMFRIYISVDDLNKEISFTSYKKYFSTYSVTDWTDKVDKSKDFNIKPITFEDKYVLFNYKDSKTKLGEKYKDTYGVNYGEYRLITEYNFNSNTASLFTDVAPSIMYTDNVLSWKNLRINHKIVYSLPAEKYVYNQDKDKKQVDNFGAFYFHCGLANFDTEAALNLVPPKISDDTPFQLANNTFFYSRIAGYRALISTYPLLDIIKDNKMCLFNIPSENYTYQNNYSGKTSIYTSIWQNYINERYNVQNKQITCYIDLKPSDFISFEWRKFVKIGNQLCIVNKIYDYDITANKPTKVDLITIQSVSGYIN